MNAPAAPALMNAPLAPALVNASPPTAADDPPALALGGAPPTPLVPALGPADVLGARPAFGPLSVEPQASHELLLSASSAIRMEKAMRSVQSLVGAVVPATLFQGSIATEPCGLEIAVSALCRTAGPGAGPYRTRNEARKRPQ